MKVKKIIFFNVIILVSFILFIEIFARLFNLADLTGISKNLIINQNKLNFNAPNIKAIAFSQHQQHKHHQLRIKVRVVISILIQRITVHHQHHYLIYQKRLL